MPTTTVPDQGQLVEVRERRWVVADVDAGELPRDPSQPLKERQHLLTLRSVEDEGRAAARAPAGGDWRMRNACGDTATELRATAFGQASDGSP